MVKALLESLGRGRGFSGLLRADEEDNDNGRGDYGGGPRESRGEVVEAGDVAAAEGDGGEGYDEKIVDEVHQHGRPDGARVEGEVAERRAEREAGYETAELEVDEAKDSRAEPHGRVGASHEAQEVVLQGAPEEELFANGGGDGDD